MRFVHISDLHIGKRVKGFSMVEEQADILEKILDSIEETKPDGVLIAGDIYDKAVPSAEAVQLFDTFLSWLAEHGQRVFVISGNHDSPERIAFGAKIMCSQNIFLSPVYDGSISPISLTDAFGTVDVYLLPFIKPVHVKRFFPEQEINSYTDAMRVVIEQMPLRTENRSVLVTHQFITGALRSESEEISIGGSDNVDAAVFAPFDYVALGHLHGPQKVQKESIRYCGSPLKYSFSEAGHQKSVTIVDMYQKGRVEISEGPLLSKRDMRRLRGSYMELTAKQSYEGTPTEDYLQITLTDEEDVPDAFRKLQTIYPNLMELIYDNQRTKAHTVLSPVEYVEKQSPLALFTTFFEAQNQTALTPEQSSLLLRLMEEAKEETL